MTPEQIALVKDSFDRVAGDLGAVAKAALTAAYTLLAGDEIAAVAGRARRIFWLRCPA